MSERWQGGGGGGAATTAGLVVLREDRHVLFVAKPARLLTAADQTGDLCLLDQVRAYCTAQAAPGTKGYVAPIHFLDRPVSGVVVYAKSSKAASRLSAAFRERRVEKIYWAVVEGELSPGRRELVDILVKDPRTNHVRIGRSGEPDAKLCRLSYETLATGGGLSLVEVKPVTGRSHQIRVQLATHAAPLVGDSKYGAARSFAGAIALHARRLTIEHPVERVPLTVEAPLPAPWKTLLDAVGYRISDYVQET